MYPHSSASKKSLAIAAMAFSTCIAPSAHACGDEVYLGMICFTAANYCPNGYIEAQGQLLPINNYQALYSLMGTTYGGDGRTTFGVPDLRGRTAVGLGQGPGLSNIIPGQMRGQEAVTQTIAQMPTHTHTATVTGGGGGTPVSVTLNASTATSGVTTPQAGYLLSASPATGPGSAAIYVNPASAGATVALGGVTVSGGGGGPGAVTIGNTGGNLPMPTITPQLGLRACISATQGLFPPRP